MKDSMQAAFGDLSTQKQPTAEVLSTSPATNHSLIESTLDCLKFAATYSQRLAKPEGTWSGESRCQASLTLEYVLLRQALGLDLDTDREALCQYLFGDQKEDGSWGIAPDGYPGDVSITTEAYLALKILRVPSDHSAMHKARTFVIGKGGVAKVRIFTRIFLAQYGLFPWAAVPQLPTELILLPRQSPINVYKLSSWARAFMIPLCIIRHHEPIYSLPNGTSANNDFLDELWLNPSDKMVPYTSSLWQLWNEDVVSLSFAVIDKALTFIGRRLGPLRTYSKKQCLEWILGHQEQCGVIQGNFPPLHFSILALVLEGYTIEDSPVCRGLDAVEKMAWQDSRGKRMQACLSTLWDTALMMIGLCDSMQPLDSPYITRAISWLKSKQHVGPNGDWRIYNPELAPGGFSFGPYDSWYPDLDDTAVVIMALLKQDPASITSTTVTRAAEWLLGMQNKDGGFGAFDSNNDALFLNKIPFSDMDALCDPSWSDVTGRVLEAFGMLLSSPHRNQMQLNLLSRIQVSSIRAIEFVSSQQEKHTGAWYGRWGCNYIYGTSGALCGLSSFTERTFKPFLNGHAHRFAESKAPLELSQESYFTSKLAQSLVPPGLSFLKSCQNPDGGWGESLETYRRPELAGKGESTPSQTAWALMGLIAYLPPEDESIIKGVKYLVTTQVDMEGGKSWKETMHTGVGFPNFYFLGYDYYRHYFPMMALGRYAKAAMEKTNRG